MKEGLGMIGRILIIGISILQILLSMHSSFEEADQTQVNLPDVPFVNEMQPDFALEPHERPEGYDDSVLTPEVALQLLEEVRWMQDLILYSGYIGNNYRSWAQNPANQVSGELIGERAENWDYLTYYIPGLDTLAKFDAYFLPVFTEDTLERFKNEICVFEYAGRLVGVNMDGRCGSTMVDWSRTIVTGIQQDDEKKAVVTVKLYMHEIPWYQSEDDFLEFKDYYFEYSEEMGWRIVLNRIGDI